MADNRTSVELSEVLAEYVPAIIDNSTIVYDKTIADGSAQVGLAVTLSGDNTVALCADADPVYGLLSMVEYDGKCSVQIEGYATFPGGLAATLTDGLKIVGALGASSARGYIRGINNATIADVAKGRGRIVNSGTATAVVVQL